MRVAIKNIRTLLLLLALVLTAGSTAPAHLAAQETAGVTITVSGRAALHIAFVTPNRQAAVGQVSEIITIQVRTGSGRPYPVPASVTVALTTTSASGAFLSSLASPIPISTVTIPAGQDSASFYYVDYVPGTYTMTAAETPASGWIAGRQTITVIPGGGGGGGPAPEPTPTPTPTPTPEPTPGVKGMTVFVGDRGQDMPVRSDGTVISTVTVTDTAGTSSIVIRAGTRITALTPAADGEVVIPVRIEVIPSPEPVPAPPPPGYAMVSILYEARAIVENTPVPISFDRPVTLTFGWDAQKYAGATDIFVAYYARDRGWISTEPPPGYIAEAGRAAGQVTHFTPFAVFGRIGPAPSPARFDVRNLTVFPREVRAGESVTISATITNIGGMRGEYVVRLNIPGLLETFQTINLAPRETQQVRFTIVPGADGTYPVELGNVGNFFTVTATPSPPPVRVFTFNWWAYLIMAVLTAAVFLGINYGIIVPAWRRRHPAVIIRRVGRERENLLLKVRNLTVTPPVSRQGSTVVVTADVTNIGENACNYSLVLKVGGIVEALREVNLRPGQKERVAFTLMKDTPGDYEVDLEGLKGHFVVSPPAPTALEPAPQPEPPRPGDYR